MARRGSRVPTGAGRPRRTGRVIPRGGHPVLISPTRRGVAGETLDRHRPTDSDRWYGVESPVVTQALESVLPTCNLQHDEAMRKRPTAHTETFAQQTVRLVVPREQL